jgi:hypothetical protein
MILELVDIFEDSIASVALRRPMDSTKMISAAMLTLGQEQMRHEETYLMRRRSGVFSGQMQ